MSAFLNRLFIFCETRNLAEVARTTGVPYNTLKNYSGENSRTPSADVLAIIAKSTGVNLNWLLLGDGPPKIDAPPRGRVVDVSLPALSFQMVIHDEAEDSALVNTERIPLYESD